jgi:hypothetical protein
MPPMSPLTRKGVKALGGVVRDFRMIKGLE